MLEVFMWWTVGGVLGILGVALGAFGAHGLRDTVSDQAMGWWETAARYHLIHALAVLAVNVHPSAPTAAGVFFTLGIVLFSGSLYTMTLTDMRWMGAITPLGDVCFMIGWGCLAFWPR